MTAVSVPLLAKLFNPLQTPPWPVSAIRKSEVLAAKRLLDHPIPCTAARSDHIGRIAFLVSNGWSDAIHIDIINGWTFVVDDGNHRLAAAIIRKDPLITVELSGSIDHAFALFGVTV